MSIPFLTSSDWDMADVVWGFSEKYLKARYDEPKPIPDIHREWWALCMSDWPQVALAAPRGHAKSTAITFAYVMFILLERVSKHLLLLGSNEDLASSFVNELKTELNENEALRKDYGVEKFIKETETEIIVQLRGGYRFRVIAKGAGQRMRGLKWERKRPDTCHAVGTKLIDGRKVESHPSFRGVRRCSGFEISIHGHPGAETVTPEHRYWGRLRRRRGRAETQRFEFDEPRWVYASELAFANTKQAYYIGDPIDSSVGDVGEWEEFLPGSDDRDAKGRWLGGGGRLGRVRPWQFSSEEWWWFFGLWWGDGHTARGKVGVTIADTADNTLARVTALLDAQGRPYHISQRLGCKQVTFADAAMSRWLKSWRVGNSMKRPPVWVERIDHRFQRALIAGYVEADGYTTGRAVRIASKYIEGLECVVRILARLGIAATIRTGRGGGACEINGVATFAHRQYDLYYSTAEDTRYEVKQVFVENGFLWRRVQSVEVVKSAEFAPIQTDTRDYRTAFGLSHNCVFDDMEDEDMVLNENRREKFRRWFYGTVRPILRGGGKIRGVGTIIGFDSLLERMMPDVKSPETVKEPLRVYSRTPKGWASIKYRAHSHDFTEILWPEQRNAEELKRIRSEYASMGMLDIYGQEYLNDPIDATTAYFRQQDFLPMRPQDFETRKTYYVGIDLAIGENDRNAYTVMVVGGIDTEGTLHIVDVRRDRIDGMQIMEEMFSIYDRWSPDTYRTESENIEKAMGSFLYREMDERQKYLNLDPRPPTKDKDKRAQSIKARMRAGKVRFNKEADWYADFEEELLKFPKAPFKDQVDAFAWLGLMLEEMVEPATDRELEEEEYQMAYEQHTSLGRCQTTGY